MEGSHEAAQQQSLVQSAHLQMQGAAMNNSNIDMASVLARLQALEKEKQDLRSSLDSTSARLSKLQEGKRAEMESMMNSTISKWLEQLDTKDQANKDLLKQGLQKLASEGNESGVWEVVACASNNWAANVNQIETLKDEINSYKEKEKQLQGGLFADEASRVGEKRKADDGRGSDMWGEIETMFMRGGGLRGTDGTESQGPRVDVNSLR